MKVGSTSLGEIATIIAGQSPPGSTYNETNMGLPFFQGMADFGEVHPTARKWCTAPKKIAESGDILISVRAPVGPTNIAEERCCIGRGLAAIRPDETIAIRDFVHWAIKHREPALVAKGQGSTFAAIGQKDLRALPIPLLPLDEQRRIVSILNRAAKIERLRAQAAELLQEFIPALFIRMFGDPVENPMRWEVKPLGEICSINPRAERSGYADPTLVSFVPMAAVDERLGAITTWEERPIADVSKGYTSFQDGDVLFAKITPCMENGKAALVRDLTNGMGSGSTEFYVLRPGGQVLGEYIYHFVRQSRFREAAKRSFTGTAGQQRVPKSFMESALIPLPPLAKQRRFAEIVGRAVSATHETAAAATRISALTASLMARLLAVDS